MFRDLNCTAILCDLYVGLVLSALLCVSQLFLKKFSILAPSLSSQAVFSRMVSTAWATFLSLPGRGWSVKNCSTSLAFSSPSRSAEQDLTSLERRKPELYRSLSRTNLSLKNCQARSRPGRLETAKL